MALTDLYTKKQLEVLRKYKAGFRLMINYGAKRSGKTVIDNDLFLMELRKVRKRADARNIAEPLYILGGVSSKTISQNVLNPLGNKYGLTFQFDKHGNFSLFGVKVVLAYTGSIAGLGGIRGLTANGAYINEASLANPLVFKEILDRCSEPGSRVICDTNPDSPRHYLKVDYLDNHNEEAGIVSTHFTLDDNTFLDKEYVKSRKAGTPSGMMYDRDIKGLWVTPEGLVYSDFDESAMIVDEVPTNLATYYCGVDWGFDHKGVIAVFADTPDGKSYLVEEHTHKGKFIDYWVKVAQDIRSRYGKNIVFWADSARPDNVNEFISAGIDCRNANKAKMAGIEAVAKRIKQGKFKLVRSGIMQFLDEVYAYVWDGDKGEPVKVNDDVMDAVRYAIYNQHLGNEARFLKSRFI